MIIQLMFMMKKSQLKLKMTQIHFILYYMNSIDIFMIQESGI